MKKDLQITFILLCFIFVFTVTTTKAMELDHCRHHIGGEHPKFEPFDKKRKRVEHLIERVKTGKATPSSLDRLPGKKHGTLRVCLQNKKLWPLVKELLQAGSDPNFDDGVDTPIGNAMMGVCWKIPARRLLYS